MATPLAGDGLPCDLPLARAYAELVELSGGALAAASLSEHGACLAVTVRRAHKSIQLNKSRSSVSTLSLDPSTGAQGLASGPVLLDGSTVASAMSPTGRYLASIRKEASLDGKLPQRTVIEIWDRSNGDLLRTLYADTALHGDVISDGWFSDFAWSPCERLLVYVAEAKAPETAGFFDAPKAAGADGPSSEPSMPAAAGPAPPCKASPYDWEASVRENSWGEKYTNVRLPRLFIASLAEGTIFAVPGTSPRVSSGQPCWMPVPAADGPSPGSESPSYVLAYVGWRDDTPRRLGMIYCYQRPCRLYGVRYPFRAGDTTPAHVCLTPRETLVRSPRLSPPLPSNVSGLAAGSRLLAFLSGEGVSLAAHNGAATLKILVLDSAWWAEVAEAFRAAEIAPAQAPVPSTLPPAIVVVPASATPIPISSAGPAVGVPGLDLPGLYTDALPSRCWAGDASSLWLSSACRSRQVVLRVDVCAALAAVAAVAPATEQVARSVSYEALGGASGYTVSLFDVLPLNPTDDPSADGRVALLVGTADPVAPQRLVVLVVGSGGGGGTRAVFPLAPGAGRPSDVAPPPWAVIPRGPATSLPAVAAAASASGACAPGSPLTAGRAALLDLRWRIVRVSPIRLPGEAVPAGAPPDFEAILLWSAAAAAAAASTGLPIVAFPHGGPHSSFTGDFLHGPAFLARVGLAVALVNFRGSTGFGVAAEASLLGRCGVQDVLDVHATVLTVLALGSPSDSGTTHGASTVSARIPPEVLALPVRLADDDGERAPYVASEWTAAVEESLRWGIGAQATLPASASSVDFPRLDPSRVCVTGGSHGGFLTTHLICQFPSIYRAAAARNPVTNIAAMVTTSDIPDWCWVEACGLDSCPGGVSAMPVGPNLRALSRMWRASPLRYVTEAAEATATGTPSSSLPRAAVLLLLGLKDLRVPPSQGIEFYNALRALRQQPGSSEAPVRLLAYPEDTHAIDKPASEADAWVHMALWLLTHGGGAAAVTSARALLEL